MTRARRLTALLVVWLVLLTTWVIWRVFGDAPPEIPPSTSAALGVVLGMPPAVFGFYQWARKR